MNRKHLLRAATAATVVLGVTGLSACSAAKTSSSSGSSGGSEAVTIAVPSWVGAEANAAVAKYILENELHTKVKLTQLDESVAFDALNSGKANVILEDWGGAPKKVKLYVDDKKSIISGGGLGVTGHIGWYIPKYLADEHPDITDYKNLNKYASLFKTAESGSKGQLLEGSPSYTTNDDALIKNLKLNLKTVYAGSEAAQITQIKESYKSKKPFISYWWTPQWLNSQLDLVEVKLPEYKKGCDSDPKKVACGYAQTPLQKYLGAGFAKNNPKAAQFLKNFNWTNAQQNEVAAMIADQKMSSDKAAEKWVKANPDVWKAWLPK
ncbi:glycine/betaine ABC transporter substrate-binding protein [Streptomyces pluripotens]|uniref:Glycine/betaine ABC transporter substrate-binding protein n=1 Tax=Streptomyces pluripotens TaxID=1355015 RepID=A0A221P928_9ACTN|nr:MULTISPECIES: ABC transporter substrate-binding protein [Streptomyces]ARP74309.1 glycine/betaine ABC transporter substrate-binding protein [Streptomyces pluripotens]ASN28586.1 glycine/betaine ABC transporter substrate-binding protein [Streptomyces pluripotens]KIE26541.1 glycine/betaine ABC transporter substrate-binding protein [Streptomyces sp. MUSC 125]MCH0556404.1 ABC transporter substrate-binding protein [Streptomyces sp. MUM 16J]